jgi:Lamin Tail Domain
MKLESKSIIILLSCISLLAIILFISIGTAQAPENSYLPMVYKEATSTSTVPPPPVTTLTPTPTDLPEPTATPTPVTPPPPTLTSTPTSMPPRTGNLVITYIFYDDTGNLEPDEYVEIRNDDSYAIQLANWTLRDDANHVYTFPSFVIFPDQVCRIYTNENHPEWCGFSYMSELPIWDNSGDCAHLHDFLFNTVDDYCYQP